jgi:hypothetical protein
MSVQLFGQTLAQLQLAIAFIYFQRPPQHVRFVTAGAVASRSSVARRRPMLGLIIARWTPSIYGKPEDPRDDQ